MTLLFACTLIDDMYMVPNEEIILKHIQWISYGTPSYVNVIVAVLLSSFIRLINNQCDKTSAHLMCDRLIGPKMVWIDSLKNGNVV